MKKTIKAPAHLSAAAKTWHKRLVDEYQIDDPGGLLLLQTACEAHDRMKAAQAIIKKDGMMIEDRFGAQKIHPLVVAERDARSAMVQALKAMALDFESDHAGGSQ